MYDALLRLADRSFVKRFAMDDFQLVVALDEVIAAYAEQTYRPRQIEIVPVCINDSVLDLVKADPGSGGPVHIVSVGHVTDMRNRAELLEAAAVLLKDGVNLRVTIAGKLLTHSTRSAVERLGIGGAIQLRGEVERTGVLSLLGEAHVEAHWLTYPGVGSASIEAMAAGLPVLARAYEGIYGDVPLRQMENVVFVDPDSVASVTEPLRALALDGCLRRRIGAAARTLVREHLTWSVTIQKFRALYRGLTG
jgi:glycosyltransferase involved in cell wall biosynthesis